jgi:hypothetical protein
VVVAAPGRHIGPYRLIERIGRGGSAVVYKAFDTARRREVAVKVISAAHTADETFLARFRQEAQLVARLRHPHILEILDSAQQAPQAGLGDDGADGAAYLVTEFMAGGSLADRLAAPREIRERCQLAVDVAQQIGAALDWAHAKGVLHRDVKPSNVLVHADGRYVLGDFGLARVLQPGASLHLTLSGLVAGTPAYMAPEQAMGEPADARTDVYGLAVVLFEIVCGQVPFRAETPMAVMLAHVHQPPPRAGAVDAAVPREIEAVLDRALSKARDSRYQSGSELARALRAAVVARFGESAIGTGVLPAVAATSAARTNGERVAGPGTERGRPLARAARRPRARSANWPRVRRWAALTAGTASVVALTMAGTAGLALGPGRTRLAGFLAPLVEDTSAPLVKEALPRSGTRDLQLRPSVSVRFSHAMDQQSVRDALQIEPYAPLDFAWDGQLLVVTAQEDLKPGATYQVTIGSDARDLEGRPLADPLQIRFTTRGAAEPPRAPGQVVAAPPVASATPTPRPPPAPAGQRPPAQPTAARGAASSTGNGTTAQGAGVAPPTRYAPPTVGPMGPDESLVAGLLEEGPRAGSTSAAGGTPAAATEPGESLGAGLAEGAPPPVSDPTPGAPLVEGSLPQASQAASPPPGGTATATTVTTATVVPTATRAAVAPSATPAGTVPATATTPVHQVTVLPATPPPATPTPTSQPPATAAAGATATALSGSVTATAGATSATTPAPPGTSTGAFQPPQPTVTAGPGTPAPSGTPGAAGTPGTAATAPAGATPASG